MEAFFIAPPAESGDCLESIMVSVNGITMDLTAEDIWPVVKQKVIDGFVGTISKQLEAADAHMEKMTIDGDRFRKQLEGIEQRINAFQKAINKFKMKGEPNDQSVRTDETGTGPSRGD